MHLEKPVVPDRQVELFLRLEVISGKRVVRSNHLALAVLRQCLNQDRTYIH